MLSFLWSFYKKHKNPLTSISILLGGLLGIIWSYDIRQLTPAGTLTHPQIFQIRSFLTLLSILLYLLSLLTFTLFHYNKDSAELINSKSGFDDLAGKHISLRQSHAKLTEQNNQQLAAIEQLTTAANAFRDEMRQQRELATEIQKELTSLKTEYRDLKERNAGTEKLALMRGRALEQCEKELEQQKPSTVQQQSDSKAKAWEKLSGS